MVTVLSQSMNAILVVEICVEISLPTADILSYYEEWAFWSQFLILTNLRAVHNCIVVFDSGEYSCANIKHSSEEKVNEFKRHWYGYFLFL